MTYFNTFALKEKKNAPRQECMQPSKHLLESKWNEKYNAFDYEGAFEEYMLICGGRIGVRHYFTYLKLNNN